MHSLYMCCNLTSLRLSHMRYTLLAWETKCHKIEPLKGKALRNMPPIAHTEQLLKKINQLKLSDLYINLLIH